MSDPPTPERTDRAISIGDGSRITFSYLNWRGEASQRHVETYRVYWGATEWHPEPGWLLSAFDIEKREHRQFAMKDMSNVEPA